MLNFQRKQLTQKKIWRLLGGKTRFISTVTEYIARWYLRAHGVSIVACNYGFLQPPMAIATTKPRFRGGEIDIIGSHHGVLVFIEVRFRRNTLFSTPLESISKKKFYTMQRTAQKYRNQTATQHMPCRFDCIALVLHPPSITWFKGIAAK